MSARPPFRLAVVGHVDHGKSTLIGRLLADTQTLPEGKLEEIRAYCERNAKPFEYAFILDALKDERAQGITVDMARIHFRGPTRRYLILDTPGHLEFLRNMVTGAAHADGAFLVIDATEGVRENSFRHGYLLSFLGVRNLAVLVTKMDAVGYAQPRFEEIRETYRPFLERLGLMPAAFIPVSAMKGDNIVSRSVRMPWYLGEPVLSLLEQFESGEEQKTALFRMPVQDVYRFSQHGDRRRIVAGTVVSGTVSVGDEVIFYPSGKRSFVATLEAFPGPPPHTYGAGDTAGFTLSEQIYITRGEIAGKRGEEPPRVSDRFRALIFWLGKDPLVVGKEYLLKIGTARSPVVVEQIVRRLDAVSLRELPEGRVVECNEVAECELKTARPLAFDTIDRCEKTARFVLVDRYDIAGGGVIREALLENESPARLVRERNYHWVVGHIDRDLRAERHGHRPHLVLVTGPRDSGKKAVARELEAHLFAGGKQAFFMGIANLLYGVDADIRSLPGTREEHMRRLGELANLLLEAGHILIVTAIEVTDGDRTLIERSVAPERIFVVWVGDNEPTLSPVDLRFPDHVTPVTAVAEIITVLRERGILFS